MTQVLEVWKFGAEVANRWLVPGRGYSWLWRRERCGGRRDVEEPKTGTRGWLPEPRILL